MTGTEDAALIRPPRRTASRLGALSVGHDNNLNLVRVLAATLVLVSHAFVLSTGNPAAEPWLGRLGTTPGGLAVDVFFAVSGFLVTGSLERSRSLRSFAAARSLRIYPGLWLSLLLTVGMVALGFTDLPTGLFFHESRTWSWLARNAVMVTGGQGDLPAAFTHVPFAGAVNGSLWTLRWELRCYLLLALIWWGARWLGRDRIASNFGRVVIAAALALTLANVGLHLEDRPIDYVQLGAMFFQGAALWVLRDRISIGWGTFAVLALAYVAAASTSPELFQLVNSLCLAWFALHVAFLPGGMLRAYNRRGDYSYGIYIFAFPIQQAIVALEPGIGAWSLVGAALLPTLALAVMSWHVVEKRALAKKNGLARRLGAI